MNKMSVEVRLFAFSTRSVVGMYLSDLDVCIECHQSFQNIERLCLRHPQTDGIQLKLV